jgi:hypothetical protein
MISVPAEPRRPFPCECDKDSPDVRFAAMSGHSRLIASSYLVSLEVAR